jgi:hypothetical protein
MRRFTWGGGIAAALSIALIACGAIQPARMALPPALEIGAEKVVITGLGGAPRGQFRVGGDSGSFIRSASRLAVFDALYEGESAVASFTFDGGASRIQGACAMKRRTANVGVLTYEFKPMVFGCDFNGAAPPARLELRESRSTSRVQSMRRERSGEVAVGNARLQLRSVHDIAGSALPVAAPIGYLFERDGRSVAAVEINGTEPVILLASGSGLDERQAIVLASLALALLWDPKETGLAD